MCCSVLQCVAVCCSVLCCVVVCCSALQCVAVRCSMMHARVEFVTRSYVEEVPHVNSMLQRVVACCSVVLVPFIRGGGDLCE